MKWLTVLFFITALCAGSSFAGSFPDKSGYEISKIRKELFRNFAKYLVDFFRFKKLDAEYLKRNIRLKNLNYIDESLSIVIAS